MKLKKEIKPHDKKPRFYGLAYVDYERDISITYPIPLNRIVSFIRKIYHWFIFEFNYQSIIDKKTNKAYSDGIKYGKALTNAEIIIIKRKIDRLQLKVKEK